MRGLVKCGVRSKQRVKARAVRNLMTTFAGIADMLRPHAKDKAQSHVGAGRAYFALDPPFNVFYNRLDFPLISNLSTA